MFEEDYMFMKIVHKDITTVTHGVIPHGVNCQGVMGSGVAKAIKEKWPEIYNQFKNGGTGKKMLGEVQYSHVGKSLWVLNCFTQEYYGRDGKRYASLEAVQEALGAVFSFAATKKLPVCMPKIGCGLGGLSWSDEVMPIVTELSATYDVSVFVYEI